METENKCSICLKALFLQPTEEDIKNINSCSQFTQYVSKEFCNEILESAHKEICQAHCKHSFHKECLQQYLHHANKNECPLCKRHIHMVLCFSRGAKTMEKFLKTSEVEFPCHAIVLRRGGT